MRWAPAVFVVLAAPAFSQDPTYVNKLAPYVASPDRIVDLMLELARIKPGETVMDLGSGDGRILFAAAEKYKAKAVGVEISPKLVAAANLRIQQSKLTDQVRVIQGDVMQADLSGADVVIMYLTTQTNADLRPRLEKYLKTGARVISHDYNIPGWKPSRIERIEGRQGHVVYLYEMPPSKQ